VNAVCQEMLNFRIEGNIIPQSWFKYIRNGSKPDLIAIHILSDILYWYRPTEVRNEQTNEIIRYKQKFAADKLQKSYTDYSTALGVTKKSVKSSIDNLVKLGFLKREFRNIRYGNVACSNVMFVEPIIENIKDITYRILKELPQDDGHNPNTPTEKVGYPPGNGEMVPPKMEGYPIANGGTYTETTPEITTYNKNNMSKQSFDYYNDGENKENISNSYTQEKLIFNEFRKIYPGSKRGNEVEFANFKKKHKNWKEILPLLSPIIQKQIQRKQELAKVYKSSQILWKNLSTWINGSYWEEEVGGQAPDNKPNTQPRKLTFTEQMIQKSWEDRLRGQQNSGN
jgi:hypothetical protein